MHESRQKALLTGSIRLLILCIGACVMLYPFIYMILSSFKLNAEIIRTPPTFFPETFTWSNYGKVFLENRFGRFFFNSIWLTVVKTTLILYSSAFFGYVFSTLSFRGKDALFLFVLATMMIPWPVTIVPQYQLMTWFGWVGEYTSLIIPSLFSTFGIYMMRQYMAAVPDELVEAARIDGAGEFTIFHRIVMPDVTAALSALGIFQFLWVWDDYLWPFLMLQSMDRYTLPVGLSLFNGQYFNDNGGIFAAATISVMPVIIVYLLFQRQFVEGIAITGIKG